MQSFFRKVVLAAYNSKCCVTGNPVEDLLVASHILPWSDFPQHRLNPKNGFDSEMRLVLSSFLKRHRLNPAIESERCALGSKRIVPGGRMPRLGLGEIQYGDNRLGEVLVSEQAHLRWNRIGLVFVGQVAGVRQAGENILSRQARVICQDIALGLAGHEQFENELDCQTRPADHWLAGQDSRIHDNAF